MAYPKKLEKPIQIIQKKLAKKDLIWLLDGLGIKSTTKKNEDGEYIKKKNGEQFIYLKQMRNPLLLYWHMNAGIDYI
jgi:hypothetical protein